MLIDTYEFFFFLQYLEIYYKSSLKHSTTFSFENLSQLHIILPKAANTIIFSSSTNFFFNAIYEYILTVNTNFFNNINISSNLYLSNYFSDTDEILLNKLTHQELSEIYRFNRFSNPIFKYDYKAGDYFPKLYKEVYTYLFPTIGDLTSGLRTT
jgi:hypothetical protein